MNKTDYLVRICPDCHGRIIKHALGHYCMSCNSIFPDNGTVFEQVWESELARLRHE